MLDVKLKDDIQSIHNIFEDLKKHIDLVKWEEDIKIFQDKMSTPDFWNDQKKAAKITGNLKLLKKDWNFSKRLKVIYLT